MFKLRRKVDLLKRFKLQISLNELYHDIKCDEILFWGKIMGLEKDYYIACALYLKNHYLFPKKEYFFCNSNNFTFSRMPLVLDYHLNVIKKYNSYFVGNPDIILEYFDEQENENLDLDDDDENIFKHRNKKKNLTEVDRLSYIVQSIDNDCFILPEGAVKMLPINEIRRNQDFRGLKTEELPNLDKYLHFRRPLTQDKKDLIERDEAVFNFNFLDNLTEYGIKGYCLNKGLWSINLDSTKTVSSLRNFKWPGFFSYHKSNSKYYGCIYLGDGIRNDDLEFMI